MNLLYLSASRFGVSYIDVRSNYIVLYIQNSPNLLNRISDLRYKTLGCFCASNNLPYTCHGMILIKLFKSLIISWFTLNTLRMTGLFIHLLSMVLGNNLIFWGSNTFNFVHNWDPYEPQYSQNWIKQLYQSINSTFIWSLCMVIED